MGEAKRRKKLDPTWGQLKLTQFNDVEVVSQTKFDSGAIPHNQIPGDLILEDLILEDLNEPHEVSTTVSEESTAPESERYRVITVNGFFKIASISEIKYQAGYEDYPPDWATRFDFEGSLSECESWLDEYQSEMFPPGRLIFLPKSPKKSSKSPRKSSKSAKKSSKKTR